MCRKVFEIVKWSITVFMMVAITAKMNPVVIVDAAANYQEEPIYIVQSGDTLNSIALRFGVSAEDLQSANGISDPNTLNLGQRLVIPGLDGITGVLTSTTLGLGTSLTDLTRQYDLNLEELVYLNRLTSPSETMAGATFIIPLNEGQEINAPLVLVQSGQTLLEEAVRKGLSPWMLVEFNQLNAPWDIVPGDKLFWTSNGEELSGESAFFEKISINPLPLIQGETVQITVNSEFPVELTGYFDEDLLYFFSDDEENYFSFHGIHALAEPGPYSFRLNASYEGGVKHNFEQLILVDEGDYANEWVFVPDEYLDQAVIAEEDAYLEPILKSSSPIKHWQGKFQYPVDEPCINSFFGSRRNYNEGGLYFYHTGVDFAVCAQNLNIYAPADGEVILAEELTIKGKAVLLDHGWGIISGYWHLSEFNVEVGDVVQKGDILGQIGDTGRSAGPHLHFEIDINGIPVNPETWLGQEFPQPPSGE